VAKLLELAHRFERLIEFGKVRDHAELARLGHVTRAWLTQIMNLLSLAPDIQEADVERDVSIGRSRRADPAGSDTILPNRRVPRLM
jgi:hypothetical protein